MKKNDVYKGFEVIEVIDAPEYRSKGLFLKHKKSGLEVFHLLNDDKENLFAFIFRTPSDDSTGVAHVLEHSVLCGSKKYPVKDPFLQLTKQSINTYLNALTACDRTIFPSSSLIKADYFNIMSVYADAVFFPLLKPEIFSQECWRLEPDEKGNISLQGVVYNEMKGNYANFSRIASDVVDSGLYPDSFYTKDSGGDPLVIPELTLEKLRAFHKKHYCTNNCLVFLYGDIPTEEQLDFLDENVVSKVSSYGKKIVIKDDNVKSPKKIVKGTAPASDESGDSNNTTICMSWKFGENQWDEEIDSLEILLLGDLLFGSDGAPAMKALLKKFPKGSMSPVTGPSFSSLYGSISVGYCFEDDSKKDEFRNTLYEVFEKLEKEGFSQDDIDRVLMDLKIRYQEVVRSTTGGPYSITIMRKAALSWTYGMEPWKGIFPSREAERVTKNIAGDKDYLVKILRKYFIDNRQTSMAIIQGTAAYTRKRENLEKSMVKKLVKEIGRDKIYSSFEKMKKMQACESDESSGASMIPAVKVSDLGPIEDNIRTRKSSVGKVPFYYTEEPTNGIVYASISFPVDILEPEDYIYLPLLEETVTDMGWGSLSWDKAASYADKLVGSFSAGIRRGAVADCHKKYMENNHLIVGREWLVFRVKFLNEKTEEVVQLLEDCICGVNFKDKKRLRSILENICSSVKGGILPHAHFYATLRAMRTINRNCAVSEIMEGFTSVENFFKFKKMKTESLISKLEEMFSRIRNSGALINVTADSEGMKKSRAAFRKFVERRNICSPVEPGKSSLEEFVALTELNGTVVNSRNPLADEVIVIPGNIGFATRLFASSPLGTKNMVHEVVAAHIIEKSELWTKIRMEGGAYGVFLNVSGDHNSTRFGTYRDPRPFDSLETIEKVYGSLAERQISQEETEQGICGVYADEIEPMTPRSRGGCGFLRLCYGGTETEYTKKTKVLVESTSDDIKKALKRFSKAEKIGESVILCGNSMISHENKEKCGKIIKLKV